MTDPTEPDQEKYEVKIVKSAWVYVDANNETHAKEQAKELMMEGVPMTYGAPMISTIMRPVDDE